MKLKQALIRRNSASWGKAFELIVTTEAGDVALQVQHDTIPDCKAHIKRVARQTGSRIPVEVQV